LIKAAQHPNRLSSGNDVDNVLEPVIHVVDDDISFRTALTRLLSCAGYAVKNYGSAGEFLVSPADSRAGCILLDLELGGPDGLDVQQTVLRQRQALPIVFMSAYSDVPENVSSRSSTALWKGSATRKLLQSSNYLSAPSNPAEQAS
jgi:DNA-binding response OmpR family regulator